MSGDILRFSRNIKKRRIIFRLFFGICAVSIVATGIIAFFYVSEFRIQRITLQGLYMLDEKEVRAHIDETLHQDTSLLPADNIFLLNKALVANSISSFFPRVKNVVIDRQWPDALDITVEERSMWAIFCNQGVTVEQNISTCFLMDESGFLFDHASLFQGNLILKIYDTRGFPHTIGDMTLHADTMNILKMFRNNVKERLHQDITKIVLKDGEIYELHVQNWYLIIDSTAKEDLAFANLFIALHSEIKDQYRDLEYIDLRFNNKIFYKFRGD